jgi:uncharacterized protein (TIGR02147 family)
MTSPDAARPVIFDYRAPHEFLQDLMAHYKATSHFSVRRRVGMLEGCSPALVSQVLSGKRRLTRDQLPAFAKVFKLNEFEVEFIDRNLCAGIAGQLQEIPSRRSPTKREPKNHILQSWLNVYVKDLVNLKGFRLESNALHKMLLGLATPKMIERSIKFLLREGFWRRTSDGKVVPDDTLLVSSNEVPNEKIRAFHKQALKVALRGLEVFPADRRKASTVLVSVDRHKLVELRDMVDSFQAQLLKFVEDNPDGGDDLIQITTHLTPVGGMAE